MKFFKKTGLGLLLLLMVTMTSCLNILEEISFKKSGNGHYKMAIDMGQMKQMMEMLKGMGGADSTGAAENPTLTIVARALRQAEFIAKEMGQNTI